MTAFTYKLKRHHDNRGYFQEFLSGANFEFKQVNISKSKQNVLRGLHVTDFAKSVTCVHGKIFDVAVSPDGTVVSAELSEENHLVMYVPPFWGHGFLALEESVVVYGQTGVYSPTVEKTLKWDAFGIDWPIKENLILSEKDAKA